MYEALNILKQYNSLGEKQLEDGTLLIGKAPHIAPLAWLHCIYSSLSRQEIINLEDSLGSEIPDSYKSFLSISNGLGVFNTTLSLYGYRRNYNRNIIDVWQPFNILTPNISERPSNDVSNIFFIGSYSWDGSLLYIDKITNKVHICKRNNAKSLYEWPDFEGMLIDELKRLVTLFDKEGKKYDNKKSTLPF